MIECTENTDGSLTITWDQNDPLESVLNDWTEQDFIDVIMEECDRVFKENESKCKQQLEEIAVKLDGKLEHYVCSDLHNEHEKYVITYNHKKR